MDLTDAEHECRRENLKRWLAERGGHAKVVQDRRLTPSQASYLSQLVNGYSFGPRAARNMERRLGMPERWLEQQQSAVREPESAYTVRPPPDLRAALEALGIALARDLDEDQRQDVADALAKLAQRRGRQRDQEIVLDLLEAGPQGKRRGAA